MAVNVVGSLSNEITMSLHLLLSLVHDAIQGPAAGNAKNIPFY